MSSGGELHSEAWGDIRRSKSGCAVSPSKRWQRCLCSLVYRKHARTTIIPLSRFAPLLLMCFSLRSLFITQMGTHQVRAAQLAFFYLAYWVAGAPLYNFGDDAWDAINDVVFRRFLLEILTKLAGRNIARMLFFGCVATTTHHCPALAGSNSLLMHCGFLSEPRTG